MGVEVYLLRHGETEWNAAGRFQGQLDSPLTRRGRDQATQLGRILGAALKSRPALPLHVSPLGRTRETSAIVEGHLPGFCPPLLEPRLQEVSTGSWDGLTHADIDAGWPGLLDGATDFDWYFRSPDGESYPLALERIQAWLQDLNGPVIDHPPF